MTATLSTEDSLQAALDADPGNHLLRYALADCLEESAGTVDCGRCRAGRDPVCRVRLLLQGGSILIHRFGEPVNVYRPN